MLRSSPVAEGRLPRLMEFRLALFPILLRLTRPEFPSMDLQGVTLPPSKVEGVLRLSKADRDCVEPWLWAGARRPLWQGGPGVAVGVRSEQEVEATRLWYCRTSLVMYCSSWVREGGAGCWTGWRSRVPRVVVVDRVGGSSGCGLSGLGEGDGSRLRELNSGLCRATACSGLG